ncbi:hypothetical protein [Blastococcus brunescens]|uniref:Uncharacterized protein n=1 Tax=Blastococcus brunescens TaxID=1564165 RepID=A0ABZ1B4L9_9ACTN|nr:hypothetical protein [Blastococcus sp. BMG 8361]WRL65327.1 hypothetical protein U6N30_06655 [Blastococcus sp. BMG 8361]
MATDAARGAPEAVSPAGRSRIDPSARGSDLRQAAGVTSDEDRWSEAQSLLDDLPTESAERRIRRSLRTRVLLVLVVVALLGGPLGFGVAWLADGSGGGSTPADVPQWQEIEGLAVAGAGLVVLFVGVVSQFRANRRMAAWRSPLAVLNKNQRNELLAVVRGREPLHRGRLPLARHLGVQPARPARPDGPRRWTGRAVGQAC